MHNNIMITLTLKFKLLKYIDSVNLYRMVQIEENRRRIRPIIECIILCGKEELALRGHRDFGDILVDGKHKYRN